MAKRTTDNNLIPFDQRTPEEAHAIRSAGGKASQEARKKKKAMAELLQLYVDMPATNKRVSKQLKNMGFSEEDMTQKLEVAHAIMRRAKSGDFYHVQLLLELTGEMGQAGAGKENNLLDAILESTAGEVDVSEIPELQHPAEPDADVVE